MAVRNIVLLGDPLLLQKGAPVGADELGLALSIGNDLRDTMRAFRQRHGWGRAIAAPQIGVSKQVVFMEVSSPQILINPIIENPSAETIEIWDDCMSFPELMVKVRRHRAVEVSYRDHEWQRRRIKAEDALAELLQHEIDHLNGIVATMRAVDGTAFALRRQRMQKREM
ncbi:MAG: peptide deformylase [Candidatus Latescibacterota bacterium]|nr:MAG: peptide deformylase [Candidatus Latescibacterota bacterium]